jgi:hypothetical protein
MIFCGSLFCADTMSVPCTPTSIEDINDVELSDGWYDELLITKNTESETTSIWDFDVVLWAKFNDDAAAGVFNWNFNNVSYLIVKRKKDGDFKWITIYIQKVDNYKDFNIQNTDITAASNQKYQYAVVPIVNGMEGFYSIVDVDVVSDTLVIADKDEVWHTHITDGFLDNTANAPSNVLTTMYGAYATIVRNTMACYDEITVNAQFVPLEDDGCTYSFDDEGKRARYNRQAKKFLKNGNSKIIKDSSGNIWLVYVNTPPTDSAEDIYNNRKITFSAVEIGDAEDEEALYEAGLINTTEEWWNS